MLLALSPSWTAALRSPRALALLGLGAVTLGSIVWYRAREADPDPTELERERRDFLSSSGRIVDGSITDTHYDQIDDQTGGTAVPCTLIYRYRIAGVTYECAQDVSPLHDHVRNIRTDLPIQVRFDPRNPGDSIVVAESWTGLRADSNTPSASPA